MTVRSLSNSRISTNVKQVAPLNSPTFTGSVNVPTPSASANAATKFYVDSVITNTQSASYTLALTDIGKIIEMNVSSANTLTVPLNSTVAFPIGTSIDVVQYGSGQTTLVAASGVTLRSNGSKLKLSGQYSAASLYKRGADEWITMGDLSV